MGDETEAAAPAPHKPGWKTTEFWLTLVSTVVGALMTSGLIADGSQGAKIVGLAAMVLGTMGYSVSRGMTKGAKLLLLAIVLPFAVGGCHRGEIQADAIAPLIEDVSARHDKLVTKDPTISDADKATYLRSTELLRRVVKEAKGP